MDGDCSPQSKWYLLWMVCDSTKCSNLFSHNTTICALNLPQLSQYKSDFTDCCLKMMCHKLLYLTIPSFLVHDSGLHNELLILGPLSFVFQQHNSLHSLILPQLPPNTSWISIIVVSKQCTMGSSIK